MFKSYASKITSFLIENKEIDKEDYEVYKYGFEILIAFITNIVIVLIIGLLFNKIFYSIVFLACYCPIRQFAGGYHANNYTNCLLIFILIFILTMNIPLNVDSQIYTLIIFTISTLSCIGIFILAPLEHRNNPLTLSEIKKYKKISKILAGIVYISTLIFMNIDNLKELSV
ncbi:MAG: accessory gene regulator B family protein [Romboutsia sp.]